VRDARNLFALQTVAKPNVLHRFLWAQLSLEGLLLYTVLFADPPLELSLDVEL
jgi:hypothetical protein